MDAQRRGEVDRLKITQRQKDNALDSRIKKYGDILKNVLTKMTEDINEIPFYMDCVEKQFEIFEVPNDIRVHLMQPYLSDRAKCLLSLLNEHDLDTFDKFKLKILQEFQTNTY